MYKRKIILFLSIFIFIGCAEQIKNENENNNSNISKDDNTTKRLSPIFTTNSSVNVNENQKDILTIHAKYAIRYSMSGENKNDFTLDNNTGLLKFVNAPDYEIKKIYNIILHAYSKNQKEETQNLIIYIQDLAEGQQPSKMGYYLPKSGQNVQFRNYDDGYYKKGLAHSFSRSSNIVTNNHTKLIWQDDVAVKTTKLDFISAKNYCKNLNLDGFTNWRLPTMNEFYFIIDKGTKYPAVHSSFVNSENTYWSSTKFAQGYNTVWAINLQYGNDFRYKDNTKHYVRCIKGVKFNSNNLVSNVSKKIVIDHKTKLTWQDDEESKTIKKSWSGAIDYCNNLNLAGFNNWRLPNINELYTIADKTKYEPAISVKFKKTNNQMRWSSTTSAIDNTKAWHLAFYFGSDGYMDKDELLYVRCTRDN